jgi:DNA-directed RNA polymerase specialized sigma24 family protein
MTWEEVKDEQTADLIEFVKYKDQPGYRELAESAFVALTFRFRAEVIDKCRKIGRHWDFDAQTADGLAEKAFERFWKYPYSFEAARCGGLTIDTCLRLYLFRIARNCFADYNRELLEEKVSPYDGTEEVIVEFPGIERLDLPEERVEGLRSVYDLIAKALATLSPKHKIIYLTYKAYEKEGYKLPRALLKKLRDELDLTQNSIRVYKNEAFQTIDKYLTQYGGE